MYQMFRYRVRVRFADGGGITYSVRTPETIIEIIDRMHGEYGDWPAVKVGINVE